MRIELGWIDSIRQFLSSIDWQIATDAAIAIADQL
jgi:hypothetical protein